MTKPQARAATANPTPAIRIRLAVTLTAILSLALLLAPRLGHAAPAASGPEIAGRWISDKTQPALDYTVAAGAAPGTWSLLVPAKALGGKTAVTVTLQRVGPSKFETVKGSVLHGSFTVSDARHAEFKAMENTDKSFHVIDQLLERP